jgi:hypothetical protein
LAYFIANASVHDEFPWDTPTRLSAQERQALAASIQEFQLGESSEGRHLIAAARRHAGRTGDPFYLPATEAFIREEQRHARELARFLGREGIALRRHSWVDSVFRSLRRGTGLHAAICVLLTAELIAQVYYAVLRDASKSPLLRALCRRILIDEAAHVRFQSERIAHLRATHSLPRRLLSEAARRFLFAVAVALVGWRHRSALAAGGYSFQRFWRSCWMRFAAAARVTDLHWRGEAAVAHVSDVPRSTRSASSAVRSRL